MSTTIAPPKVKQYARGVAIQGRALHLSNGPFHSKAQFVDSLCGVRIILDRPLIRTSVATCTRCRMRRDPRG